MQLVRIRAGLGVQQGSHVSQSGKYCDPILESARSRSSDHSPGGRASRRLAMCAPFKDYSSEHESDVNASGGAEHGRYVRSTTPLHEAHMSMPTSSVPIRFAGRGDRRHSSLLRRVVLREGQRQQGLCWSKRKKSSVSAIQREAGYNRDRDDVTLDRSTRDTDPGSPDADVNRDDMIRDP